MFCEYCRRGFQGKRSTARYCSAKCRKLAFLSVPLEGGVSVLSVPESGVSVPEGTVKSVSVLSVPCEGCLERDREITKLKLRISVLEIELKAKKDGKSPAALPFVVNPVNYPSQKANQSWRRG